MIYYVKKSEDLTRIEILGKLEDCIEIADVKDELGNVLVEGTHCPSIPPGTVECTEAEYNQYFYQMNDQINYIPIELLVENKKIHTRSDRDSIYFKAFDIFKTNVQYGIDTETTEERTIHLTWYQTWLDLPNIINETNYQDVVYPDTPPKIAKYI